MSSWSCPKEFHLVKGVESGYMEVADFMGEVDVVMACTEKILLVGGGAVCHGVAGVPVCHRQGVDGRALGGRRQA